MKIRVLVFLSLIVLFSVCGRAQDKFTLVSDGASYDVHGLVFDGANDPYLSSSDTQTLANEIIGTGVKWVMLAALWFYSEPNAPTSSCQPGSDCYCGPKAACHNYNFAALDQLVNALDAAGINVVIRFELQPTWAGGNSCAGFCPNNEGGVILSSYMNTFSNNLYDLAYNMATRYKGKVNTWAIWNEPNLGGFFSPQDLNAGGGYNTNEYMVLIQFPANAAILTANPGALLVGPDLYTPVGGGNQQTCDYYNHCGTVFGWETSMLEYFHAYFPIFTIHNYSDTPAGQFTAIANTMNIMETTGQHPILWLTEFGFEDGTCSFSQNTLLSYISSYYASTIARSFYYQIDDGFGVGPSCGAGLVQAQNYGWAEKIPLYPGFQSIVNGN